MFHIIFLDHGQIITVPINSANISEKQSNILSESIQSTKTRLKYAKKVLFGYGQNCCHHALDRLCNHALEDAHFDKCFKLNQSSLDPQFVTQHRDIFEQNRGAGFWLWKPYLIYSLLTDDTLLRNGDYLVYLDAGSYPIAPFDEMFEFIDTHPEYNGVLFFGVGLPQKQWCKRDAYILQHCDEEKCWNAGQINAFVSIWKKSDFAIKLAKMWLHEASNKSILCDGASKFGKELEGFRDHRHDQAVITNIMNREGFPYGPSGWRLEKYIVHDRYTG